jgi:hypothetical protein
VVALMVMTSMRARADLGRIASVWALFYGLEICYCRSNQSELRSHADAKADRLTVAVASRARSGRTDQGRGLSNLNDLLGRRLGNVVGRVHAVNGDVYPLAP